MIPPPPPPPPHHSATPLVPALKAWHEVLGEVGLPMDVVCLDWETYFDVTYSLRDVPPPVYIEDERFEELALAHLHVDARAPHINPDDTVHVEIGQECIASYIGYLQKTYGKDLEGCTLVAHNAPFDFSILAMRYGVFPRHTIDTLDLARAYHSRSKNDLKTLCTRWKLKEKGNTADFKALSFKPRWVRPKKGPPILMPPANDNQVEALAHYAGNDICRTFELLQALLPLLSNPKDELRVAHLTLELATKPVLMYDEALGQDIIKRMNAKMDAAVATTGLTAEEISGTKSFEWALGEALQKAGDTIQRYMKVGKQKMLMAIAKDDEEGKALAKHPDETVRNLMAARTTLKSMPLHVARVNNFAEVAKACGGKLPIPLRYAGAHTGRDSGSWNLNPQNLGRRGDAAELRGLLIAPPDQELVIADLSAIEARILPYLADQDDLTLAFRDNADVYCQFGSMFYGMTVRKPRPTDPPMIAAKFKAMRDFSKVCILGMGYGMGKDRFQEYATCDEATAERAVKVYRDKYQKIVGFWRAIERAFLYTVRYRRPCSMPHGLSFHSSDDVDVTMTLPNGRAVRYHRVKLEAGKYGDQASIYNEITHSHERVWAGVLTENAVQSIARDVLFEAMLRVEDAGYHVCHRVHDEIIMSVGKGWGEEALRIAIREMSRSPVWAPTLPLAAEGCVSPQYAVH